MAVRPDTTMPQPSELPNNYQREIKPGVFVDLYDVLVAFDVTNPAAAHAVKKIMCSGKRGVKSKAQDLIEARQALDRAIEMALGE
jgi:hypothetical protein